MLTEQEHQSRHSRSQRRWTYKRQEDVTYDQKKHSVWCDENNVGVTHFGIDPLLLPRGNLRFDTFHMKCAVVRWILTCICSFVLNHSIDVGTKFDKNVLSHFWNDYHIFCWNNKSNFSSFQGNDLALFVANTKRVSEYLEHHFVATKLRDNIISSLSLLPNIFSFLSLTYIRSHDSEEPHEYYNCELKEYVENVKRFYDIGADSFLIKSNEKGDNESFYFHVMQFYIPPIAATTFERHRLGVGIFTMQGFERRNKESKNTLSRFSTSNLKNNILHNNVSWCYDIFYHEINAY